ncbi:MAG: peptidylprolyl isomerase [Planctomycetes bacterium]|nr:peptidylprolyl isomerase [Planctomycetota bacterium]MBU1518748.1 peptidylprolyl isomerase [Planctomycetota bacterium]MBU2597043.1 peptidylprolyl isomerase [Planctomycetota bacterium]
MNSFKNILLIVVAVLLVVGTALFVMQQRSAEKPKAPVAEPNIPVAEVKTPVAEPAPVKDVNTSDATAVTVNGAKITEGQIAKILNSRMEQLASRIPPNMQDQYRQQMRKRIIEQLAIEEMLAQKEREKNIAASPAELEEEINKQLAQQNLTIDEFKSLLKAYGTTYSEYEQNMLKKLMFEKLMEAQFVGKITPPTDEQIKAYYNENAQQFQEPEKIHTGHILITPAKDSNDPNQAKAQARAKAEKLLKQLKGGADFNDLAIKNSQCPSAKKGGDLGESPKGSFVPEFEKAAYALKPGQLSDVVETQFGFHIIKLVKHIDANTMSLEQAKAQIVEALTDKQKNDIVVNYIQQLKKETKIDFANPADNFELNEPKPIIAPIRPSSPGTPRGEAGKTEPNPPKGEVSPKADSKK